MLQIDIIIILLPTYDGENIPYAIMIIINQVLLKVLLWTLK
ncbi:MAG: hypothetical protein ACRD6U_05990 [Nitrososphaeraceae archaeon]